MKKTKNLLMGLLAVMAVVMLFLNLSAGQGKTKSYSESVKLKNISVIQASAGEYSCDQKNQNCCSYPGMSSNGALSYVN